MKAFVRSNVSDAFTFAEVKRAAPGVSDEYIRQVLRELRDDGVIEGTGAGRGAALAATPPRPDLTSPSLETHLHQIRGRAGSPCTADGSPSGCPARSWVRERRYPPMNSCSSLASAASRPSARTA